MKKILAFVMVLLLLSLCVMVTSCDDDNDSNGSGGSPCSHSYGNWITDNDATCTSEGMVHRICENCGASQTQKVSALGHNFVDGSCTVCGAEE